MPDTSKIFQDVADMIQITAKRRLPVSEAMPIWFRYCIDTAPEHHLLWKQLADLDFESDFQRLTGWLANLLHTEPPPENINGLWFGLWNPVSDEDGQDSCQFYLSGSRIFDPSNPYDEWHCNTEYWPDGRYSDSEVLDVIYRQIEDLENEDNYDEDYDFEGEDYTCLGEACLCHGYVAAVVANWCSGPLAEQLLRPGRRRAIAMGHDSGGLHFIHLPDNCRSDK